MNENNERNVALSIVLSIITCGIYAIYWFIVLNDEVKEKSGDTEAPSGAVAFLLTLVTCGIYGIYWAYKIGEMTKVAQEKNKLPVKDNSILYLVLELFGLGIIVYALVQNDMNQITNVKKGAAQ